MQLKENVSEHTDFLKSQTRKQALKDHILAFFTFQNHSRCTGNDYSKVPVINKVEGGPIKDEFMVEK